MYNFEPDADDNTAAPDGIEPNKYFAELKTNISKVDREMIEANRVVLKREITKAKSLGQKNLLHKSSFIWQVLDREMIAVTQGIVDFVYHQDVTRFIDEVKPANSVRVVELENYPRVIPDENAARIKKVQDLGIFEQLIVVYTDFTDEDVSTPAQAAYVARNTDPVVFGMFFNEALDYKHDRLYLITDWDDEYCDLTFSKMIERMSEMGIEDSGQKIVTDPADINTIVEEAMGEVKNFSLKNFNVYLNNEKLPWIKRVRKAFAVLTNG